MTSASRSFIVVSLLLLCALLTLRPVNAAGWAQQNNDKDEAEYIIAKGLHKVQKISANMFMHPGYSIFVAPIWYKYEDSSWFWTPFGPANVTPQWIPVAETKFPTGVGMKLPFSGKTSVFFNRKIIQFLEKHNPDPATDFVEAPAAPSKRPPSTSSAELAVQGMYQQRVPWIF